MKEKKKITTYDEAVAYIFETPRFTTKNKMEDTKAFLHKLGDPDKSLRIIHVAGTNGKGSVCAYMRCCLEAAGKKVAVFTSPHLVDVRERFLMDGEMISKEDFLEAFRKIYGMLSFEEGSYHPTFFEFMFFIAMIVFPKYHPDFCILETGLGGRLDATNSVADKELSVITHISLDHVEYLGDTVEKIAFEKAGIMQNAKRCIVWDTCEGVTEVFKDCAKKLGTPLDIVSKSDYQLSSFKNKSIDFSICTRYYSYISCNLNTIAAYQMENATLAVRAVELLEDGGIVTKKNIIDGLNKCFWAGRMEEILPEVYVDGAHNEDGIRAFLESVEKDNHDGDRTLLFSVVKDKDYKHMVNKLVQSGLFSKVAITHMKTGRALSTEELTNIFAEESAVEFLVYEDARTALHELVRSQRQKERIYIAGSLYLAGEIKELLRDDKF